MRMQNALQCPHFKSGGLWEKTRRASPQRCTTATSAFKLGQEVWGNHIKGEVLRHHMNVHKIPVFAYPGSLPCRFVIKEIRRDGDIDALLLFDKDDR